MINEIDYKPEYALLSNAIINVTDDCNLQCRYCFVE
jgi:MoaA/NifB/PqqE/SkfB family radical SAM enzyme